MKRKISDSRQRYHFECFIRSLCVFLGNMDFEAGGWSGYWLDVFTK